MKVEVQDYINAVTDERRALFDTLHALIMGLYPDADVVISYGIPTYRAKGGWAGLGYWKQGVSLYTNGPHHLAEFVEAHPRIKTGKGSINFRTSDRVPAEAVEKVVRSAVENVKPPA